MELKMVVVGLVFGKSSLWFVSYDDLDAFEYRV